MNMENNKIKNIKEQKNWWKIAKGSIISIILSLLLLFLFAIVFTYTNISETFIPVIVITVSAISILTGSIFSSIKIKKNGLINGGMVGTIYIITIYLLSSCIITGFSLNYKSLIMLACSILAGMIGGIIGVNIYKN